MPRLGGESGSFLPQGSTALDRLASGDCSPSACALARGQKSDKKTSRGLIRIKIAFSLTGEGVARKNYPRALSERRGNASHLRDLIPGLVEQLLQRVEREKPGVRRSRILLRP